MAGETKKLDMEELKKQDKLTPAQEEQLQKEAAEEAARGTEKPEDKETLPVEGKEKEIPQEKTDEELLSASDEGLSEPEKTRKVELIKAKDKAEEERILNAKDEELNEEDKVKKTTILKAKEDAKQKAIEEEIQAYAKESNISIEEARSDLESISKIKDKYKDDPKQLAKAVLYIQRLYTKTQEDLKAAKTPPPSVKEISIGEVIKLIDAGKITLKDGKVALREEVIEAYREKYPEKTETADGETVIKMAAEEIAEAWKLEQKEALDKLGTQAKEKRETLLTNLSETDKQFLPDLKPLLEKIPDNQVVREDFSLTDMLLWAKGKKYDELQKQIKEAEEKGYKRGLEEAKILGSKPPIGAGQPPAPKSTLKRQLSEKEKKRALEMYEGQVMTDEQKFEAYLDVYPEPVEVHA